MCGATSGQKQAAGQELNVAQEMGRDFSTVFGQDSNIFTSLTSALQPIAAAGPSQYGFSPAEDAAMRTQAMEQTSQAGRETSQAVNEALASRGGGNMYLPTGTTGAIEAGIAEQTAQQNAAEQANITQAGYQTGRQNWQFATEGLAKAPTALSEGMAAGQAASGAAGTAMQGQTDIAQANQAWIAPVAGMIGAVGGAAMGKIPGVAGQGCWIAAAVYDGWDDERTRAVRNWLFNIWAKRSFVGTIITRVYLLVGRPVAFCVKRSSFLKRVFKSLFDVALRKSYQEKEHESH